MLLDITASAAGSFYVITSPEGLGRYRAHSNAELMIYLRDSGCQDSEIVKAVEDLWLFGMIQIRVPR